MRNADAASPHGVIGCARTVTKGSTMMTKRTRSSRNLRPALVAAAGIVLSAAFLATLFSDRFAPRIRAAVAADPISAAALLPVGSAAPDFTTVAHDGAKVELSKLKGKWVVLYFYPKDDTTGCTKEACDFRDNWGTLQKKGVAVYGVSTQDNTSQRHSRRSTTCRSRCCPTTRARSPRNTRCRSSAASRGESRISSARTARSPRSGRR